jgi:hypothetical protein
MARRYRDVFAWWRIVMGPHGPTPITRLVLSAHVQFMDRDGSNCRVGARHLAIVTGLNKTTVANHRARAIEAGWLIASPLARHSSKREYCTAVPDSLITASHDELSRAGGQQLSSSNGQSTADSTNQLSGLSNLGVRFEPPNRPVARDIPLRPLLPLSERDKNSSVHMDLQSPKVISHQQRLERWLITDERVRQYKDNVDALSRLAPLQYRFAGYEEFIRRVMMKVRN